MKWYFGCKSNLWWFPCFDEFFVLLDYEYLVVITGNKIDKTLFYVKEYCCIFLSLITIISSPSQHYTDCIFGRGERPREKTLRSRSVDLGCVESPLLCQLSLRLRFVSAWAGVFPRSTMSSALSASVIIWRWYLLLISFVSFVSFVWFYR